MADRTCSKCGKVIYYGIYCSNVCSDAVYRDWKKQQVKRSRRQ